MLLIFFDSTSMTTETSSSSSTVTESSTVTKLPDSTSSTTPMFNCSEVDGRNVFWEGDPWELVQKKCDEGSFTDETFSNGKQYYVHYNTSTC